MIKCTGRWGGDIPFEDPPENRVNCIILTKSEKEGCTSTAKKNGRGKEEGADELLVNEFVANFSGGACTHTC